MLYNDHTTQNSKIMNQYKYRNPEKDRYVFPGSYKWYHAILTCIKLLYVLIYYMLYYIISYDNILPLGYITIIISSTIVPDWWTSSITIWNIIIQLVNLLPLLNLSYHWVVLPLTTMITMMKLHEITVHLIPVWGSVRIPPTRADHCLVRGHHQFGRWFGERGTHLL